MAKSLDGISEMSKPVRMPAQGQVIDLFEDPEEAFTSTLWDESDPCLVELWKRGKVFASPMELLAAQKQERTPAPPENIVSSAEKTRSLAKIHIPRTRRGGSAIVKNGAYLGKAET